jgi:hypothetical protein
MDNPGDPRANAPSVAGSGVCVFKDAIGPASSGPLRHGELDLAYGVTSKTVPQPGSPVPQLLVLVPPLEVLPYRLPVLLKIRPV